MAERVSVEDAERALLSGACSVPRVGTPISRLTTDQLMWAEDRGFLRGGSLPLWVLSSGYGYGYGSSSGYGYGSSSGYGYGSSSGYGGYGYGYGYGSGSGSGYGSGYGGYGYGYGYGSGSGYGSDGYGSGDDLGAKILSIRRQGAKNK